MGASAWGPPSASGPAGPHLLSPPVLALAGGLLIQGSAEVEHGSGIGSFKEGLPHTCPLQTQPCWGPQDPQPTQRPSAVPPGQAGLPIRSACPSHPGSGLAAGVPRLVSGLLPPQRQLSLLQPQGVPWAGLPVFEDPGPPGCWYHPRLKRDWCSRGDQGLPLLAAPSRPQARFSSHQLLPGLWSAAGAP